MTQTGWNFHNSYTKLPEILFTRMSPAKVPSPQVVKFNEKLAKELNLPLSVKNQQELANIWSGNILPPGTDPIAQAYSGHQFGYYTVLGDGRAIVVGEHIDSKGNRFDIQFKGSGQTPYSRRGDGKATLSSMLREFLISEAMYTLGIPSSRSLAVVETGEKVERETMHRGAVLTRVASSHIRVGTFEYAREFLSPPEFTRFTEYVIQRHCPHAKNTEIPALEMLKTVMERQASLVSHWMRVGFIHGVMNTDNTGIAGETFDYGPCAFMNTFDPDTVFSSIDHYGRYAFGNQPAVMHWNLGVLAGSLLPLIHADEQTAVGLVKETLDRFPELFEEKWTDMMRTKLGLEQQEAGDKQLAEQLLHWMHQNRADYTNTFLLLKQSVLNGTNVSNDPEYLKWHERWTERRKKEGSNPELTAARMQSANPIVIPRNHLVEQVLTAAAFENNMLPFNELMDTLSRPYQDNQDIKRFQEPPPGNDAHYKTYCGT